MKIPRATIATVFTHLALGHAFEPSLDDLLATISSMQARMERQDATIAEHQRLIRKLLETRLSGSDPGAFAYRELTVVSANHPTRIDAMSVETGLMTASECDCDINATLVSTVDLVVTGDILWQGMPVRFDPPTPVPTPVPTLRPTSQPTIFTVRSCSDERLINQGSSSGVYEMDDGTFRECDLSTAGGGWTMVARVNEDFSWICPDQGGANCLGASPTLAPRSNLWHSSHWASSVALAPGSTGLASGVSTQPYFVRSYCGSSSWDVRFSFYDSASDTLPAADGYARFTASSGANMFTDAPSTVDPTTTRGAGDYTWTTLAGSSIFGETICWVPDWTPRSYEGGLFMGSGSCHMNNDVSITQLKSHYATSSGWYAPQHSLLLSNVLQVPYSKIAVWVREAI